MKRFALVATVVVPVVFVLGFSSTAVAVFLENFEGYTNGSAVTAQGWTAHGGVDAQPVSGLGEGHDGVTPFGLTGTGAFTTSGLNVGAFIAHGQSFSPGDTIVLMADMVVNTAKAPDNGIAILRVGFTNAGLAATGQGFYDNFSVRHGGPDFWRLGHELNAADSAGGAGFAATDVDYTAATSPLSDGEWMKLTLSHVVGGDSSIDVRSYSDLSTVIFSNTASHNWGATGDNFDSVLMWGWQGVTVDNISVAVTPVPEPTSIALASVGGCAMLFFGIRRRKSA